MDQQNIKKQYQYPTNLHYDADHLCIDHRNNILYIVDRKCIISLDIMKNKWNFFSPECTNDTSTHSEGNNNGLISPKNFSKCHFIPSPMNELHVMTANDHYKYNQTENTITNLQNRINLFDTFKRVRNMFYRRSTQQLFMFCQGSSPNVNNSGEILICDANNESRSWSKWRKYEKGLPKRELQMIKVSNLFDPSLPALPAALTPFFDQTYETDLILAFDQILFCFEFVIEKQCDWISNGPPSFVYGLIIWCLDLDHNNKWYQATHDYDFYFKYKAKPHVIKDDDNNVHLMRFDGDNRYHLKASLGALIPTEIINLNKDKCESLCIGYIKDFERFNEMIFIPMYLKKIIVKFHPIFV